MAETAKLKAMAERVAQLHRQGDPNSAIDSLVAEHGAVCRFSGGTYHLRLAGVGGSCTSGGDGLLTSWLRAAHRRIAQAEGGA